LKFILKRKWKIYSITRFAVNGFEAVV
jgi:hypothetical protein